MAAGNKRLKASQEGSGGGTDDAGHWQCLLQLAHEHLSLVEHLGGLVLRLLGMNEDRSEEVGDPVLHPQLLHPAGRVGPGGPKSTTAN